MHIDVSNVLTYASVFVHLKNQINKAKKSQDHMLCCWTKNLETQAREKEDMNKKEEGGNRYH